MTNSRSQQTQLPAIPASRVLLADPDQQDVVISFNPNSGATDRRYMVNKLREGLEAENFRVHIPDSIEALFEQTEQLLDAETLRAVVAAGGDGTVSLLVNNLPPRVPIAVYPMGTENLLAKYLSLEAQVPQLVEMVVHGRSVLLDVGRANGKCFLVMAGCGFDAEVVRRLHRNRKGHIRHWSYAAPIVGSMGQYRFPKIRIRIDDEPEPSIESKWAFVFNAPRYAMNLPFVETADTMDGMLDLCTFRGGNVFQGLMYLAGVTLRRHHRWKDCIIRRARKLTLEADGVVPYQLDGDPGGFLPLEIEVVPEFLRVLIPRSKVLVS